MASTPPIQQSHSEISLIRELLLFGKALTLSGADVRFVETTLERLGKTYGAVEMNVFVISAAIIITAFDDAGDEKTQSIRISKKIGYDFTKLEGLSHLADKALESPMSLDEFRACRIEIDKSAQTWQAAYAGAILGAGGFAIFFGGTPLDGLVAALVGIFFCALSRTVRKYCPNDIVFNALACFLSGLAITGFHKLFPMLMVDMITIGVIMLPIPGIPITNAVRDMLSGDIITGILRFVESLLITAGIAAGFLAALSLGGA